MPIPIRIRNAVVISGGGFEPLVHEARVANGVLFPKLNYNSQLASQLGWRRSALATSASATSPRRRP